MALPPTFSARVTGGVVARRQPERLEGVSSGLSALARGGQQAQQIREQTDRQVREIDERIAERERERDRRHASADIVVNQLKVDEELAIRVQEIELSADPGAPDHSQKVREELSKAKAEYFAQVPNDEELHDQARRGWAAIEARYAVKAETFAAKKRIEKAGDDYDAILNTGANLITSDPTPENYQSKRDQAHQWIDGSSLDGAAKERLKKEIDASYAAALLDGQLEAGNYEAVGAMLDSDDLAPVLSKSQTDRYRDRVVRERKAAALEAERVQVQAQRDVAKMADALEEKVRQGINPTGEEIQAVRAAAEAVGMDPDEIIALQGMEVKARLNRALPPGSDPADARAYQKTLAAKIAAGTASEAEQIAYKHVGSRINELEKVAAEERKELLANGVPGRMQAIAGLPADPASRFAIGEQIEPGLGYTAMLSKPMQARVLAGREVLADKSNRDLIDNRAAKKVREGALRHARAGMQPGQVEAWSMMADRIYAQLAYENGWKEFRPGDYRAAIRLASGGVRRNGEWQGGLGTVRGKGVLLPDGMSEREFDRRLSRLNISVAGRTRFGDPIGKEDFLQNYTPIWIGDDEAGRPFYAFRDARGDYLGSASEKVYRWSPVAAAK